ncbi:2 [Octopus vulgaris]|uniref:2 n=1 Tax=Octopus vulgaris TaxID=6645 RepID=A0AA36C023_OCTVU|nr:2 [Octopus vulgaris] [Octopus vulgaris]
MVNDSAPDTDESPTLTSQDLLIGCTLAIVGNLLISVSLNLQKYTHMRNSRREVSKHYLSDPLWWFGLLLMGFGELGNFSAYGYAPASLVAPLGTTTVVANLFVAALFLREKIKPENIFGSALAIVGACLLVTFSQKKERILNGDEITQSITEVSFIVYICIEVAALAVVCVLLYRFHIVHVVIYLLITSITASFTVISAKAVSSMLHLSLNGFSQFHNAIFYIMLLLMIITIILQIKYLNLAMKHFNATVVVPTNFVFFTISAILAGTIFYKEFFGMNTLDICMFLFGCLLSFIGVYFVTGNRLTPNSDDAQPLSDAEEKPVNTDVPPWLSSNMQESPVQPKGGSNHHLSDADRNSSHEMSTSSTSDSFNSQDTLFEKHTKTAAPHYGTNY